MADEVHWVFEGVRGVQGNLLGSPKGIMVSFGDQSGVGQSLSGVNWQRTKGCLFVVKQGFLIFL